MMVGWRGQEPSGNSLASSAARTICQVLDYPLFVLGLAGILAGARWLVTGAGRLASTLNVAPIVIGLTVVGFGTSAPELVVSAFAAAGDQPELALGNVVGSNIANVGLVLGACAVVAPLRPDLTVLRREGPIMVAVTVVVVGAAHFGTFEQWMGLYMLGGALTYVIVSFLFAGREPELVKEEYREYETRRGLIGVRGLEGHLALLAAGLAALIVGARLLVEAAQGIAGDLGVPEFVVASSIIAVGTSIPELATGIVAARRGQADIAVGNIIGSNIFNLLGVLGIASAIRAIEVNDERLFDLYIMLIFAIAGLYLARTGRQLARWEGGMLLTAYAAFTVFLYSQ